MKLNIIKLLIVGFAILTIHGCGTWVKPSGNSMTQSPDGSFKVKTPSGWMLLSANNLLLMSVEGPDLQKIVAQKKDHEDAFENIKKPSKADMLASELAELTISNLKAESSNLNIEVLSNQPVTIDNKEAFRVHMRFYNDRGLTLERIVYGLADKKGFYRLIYQAPKIYYFSRSLNQFETVVKSFQRI